jgi:hypothetical protein
VPVTEAAAALTDRYRELVLAQRTSAGTLVGGSLAAVDLDLTRARVTSYLARWAAASASAVVNAQSATAGLTKTYLMGYLAAAGAPVDLGPGVDLSAHVGVARDSTVDALLAIAAKGLLWRLGTGAGRDAALGYGQQLAERAANVAVSDTARDTLTDLMVASPEVVGYRRVTAAQTCKRCALAAERVYKSEVLLPRHPSCRCTQEPVLALPARFARPAPVVVRP